MLLADKVAVISGAASPRGIGLATARLFAAHGAKVAILDLDEAAARDAAAGLGAEHRGFVCDVTDPAGCKEAARGVLEAFGQVDVLVNNAGKDDRHELFGVEPDAWNESLALNLHHQFFCTQAVARGMTARGHGSIILLGSVSWMRGRPGMVGYTTAKAAIHGLTRTLARELGPGGVRVNCIVPGAILTERQERLWLTPELNQKFIDLQALKLRLDAGHVARMALFLASDDASGCTGADFLVDAGLTLN